MAGRQIVIDIIGDSKKFTQATDSAIKATVKMESRMDRLKGGLIEGLGLGGGLAAFNIVGKGIGMVTDFMGDAIDAASDMAEAQSKVTVVFGDQADAIRSWAAGSSQSMGISERAALKAAGTFGNLFDGLGVGEQQAADLSQKVVQLASDLGSFNNVPVDEALQALQSGLLGEAEPMRRFGVALSEAKVQAYGMENGLGELVKTGKTFKFFMTDAQKVQARFGLIMKGTANAQGDFARTSSGLANSQKTLASNIDNLTVAFGQLLTGPAAAFTGFLIDITKVFLPRSGDALRDTSRWLAEYTEAVYGAARGQEVFNETVESGPAPIKLYTDALDSWIIQQGDLLAQLDSTGGLTKMLTDVNRKLAFQTGMTADELFQLAQVTQSTGGDIDEMTIAMQRFLHRDTDVASMAMRYVRAFDPMSETTEQFTTEWTALTDKVRTGQATWQQWSQFLVSRAEYIRANYADLPGWMQKAVVAAGIVAEQASTDVAPDVSPTKRAVMAIVRAYEGGVVDMKNAIKNGKAGIVEEFRLLAWQSKNPFAETSYAKWLEGQQKKALSKMREAAKNGRPSLVAQYRALYQEITGELEGLPGYAARLAQRIKTALTFTVKMGMYVDPDALVLDGGGGKKKPKKKPKGKKAAGGPVMAGASYLVGERGPEVVTMGANGHVTPNHRLGGGSTYNIHVNVAPGGDLVEAGRQMVRAITSFERRSGRVWRAA